MYIYSNQYFRTDQVCFKHFLDLHRISLQGGFGAYMKFEKYFCHSTTPQFIHLNERISLLYILAQSYLSSELLFLPKLPLDVLRVLQGLVEMPLPPCPLCTSRVLCLRCSCRDCHFKPAVWLLGSISSCLSHLILMLYPKGGRLRPCSYLHYMCATPTSIIMF